MLSCRFPSVIFWGPELIQFYNDAYLPLMAEKHPGALGQRGAAVWEEAWHIIGPEITATLAEGTTVYRKNVLVPVTRDGRLQDVYWTYSYSPIFSGAGVVAGVLIVCQDVTGEILAERDRDVLGQSLHQVLDATTDCVLSIDREWRITYLNPCARDLLSPSGDIVGNDFWKTFPAAVYEGSPYEIYYRLAMDDRIPGEFEAFYPEPLNAWFTISAQPSRDGIVLFFRDVTGRRRDIAARQFVEESLRESEARLKAIYDTTHEYVALLSPDGTVLDCNQASLRFANNERADVLGQAFWETPLFSFTPGAPAVLREAIARVARGEVARHELTLRRPSGEELIFDFALSPIFDEGGGVKFLVPEARDITELKRAEAALIQNEKLAAVGRLAASIAHEINNPLESVTNLLYLARGSNELTVLHEYLETAERELQRVSVIANQTLRFYKQSTRPKLVSCEDLIHGVLTMHQGRIVNSRVTVEQKKRATRSVLCFEGEIRQVLNNLIANALDAMHATGGRLLVRSRDGCDWQNSRNGLIVTVADTGCGISPEAMGKIFQAFFTTKGIGGTGLGLWLSQEIVHRHKGFLRVRSRQRPGASGTVFTLFLPYEAASR